jgi:hypothetical protein
LKWAGKGAILFHKPHSSTIIDHIKLKANGKRMREWFGWSEKTFVLTAKSK